MDERDERLQKGVKLLRDARHRVPDEWDAELGLMRASVRQHIFLLATYSFSSVRLSHVARFQQCKKLLDTLAVAWIVSGLHQCMGQFSLQYPKIGYRNETPSGRRKYGFHHTLTNAVKSFVQEKKVAFIGPNGKTAEKQTDITYTYKANNLADWAKRPEVLAVMKNVLDGAGNKESKHAIKLTSQGWEAKGPD